MNSHALAFVSYGARIAFESNRAELIDSLAARLPPSARPTAAAPDLTYRLDEATHHGAPFYRASRDGTLFLGSAERLKAIAAVASDAEFNVAVHARRRLFVHAGVVGWRGRAILIPGRTFSGKTTLVAALLRAGASYASDEFAVFDRGGRVHPFPRPLTMRDDAGRPEVVVEPTAMRGGIIRGPMPVGLILLTHYAPGAMWDPVEGTPAEGLLGLLDSTVLARRRPRLAMATLERAVEGSRMLEGPRGDAVETADAVLEALDDVD